MSVGVEENGSVNPAVVGIDLGSSGRKFHGSVVDQRFRRGGNFHEKTTEMTVSAAARAARLDFLLLSRFS